MSSRRLTLEERELVRHAQRGGGAAPRLLNRPRSSAPPASYAAPSHLGVSYPEGANVHTLELLGRIDALLKAPPEPPRWALTRVHSILEEFREAGQ